MSGPGSQRRILAAAGALLLGLVACTAPRAVRAEDDPSQWLKQADTAIKLTNHAEFVKLLQRIEGEKDRLSSAELWRLRYLKAWQAAYVGDYDTSRSMLNVVIDDSGDTTLRFRALATLINILGDGHRYEEAFSRLSQMLELLPQIDNATVRYQGLGEAAQLLVGAGQYDLAMDYADQMLAHLPPGENSCKGTYFKLHARYRSGELKSPSDPDLQNGIDTCMQGGNTVVANSLRMDQARLDIQQGHIGEAVAILRRNYTDVLKDQYAPVTSQFEALLAQAYWEQNDPMLAEKFALTAVDSSTKSGFTEPLSMAYDVLYRIAQQRSDYESALVYHEKYMAADKGYLDDVSARTLAFQVARQQVEAKKQQVETLNRQNEILRLQQALDRKAVENGRLYILLLITVLIFIGLWILRLKRSQLRFMRLARRDTLTGILNRQHFVSEAESALRQAKKASRCASLILVDLDHFKQINDAHGHAIGDQVLKRVVTVCQQQLRSTDVFGRLGGEEFGVLLPECALQHVVERAEQLRREIATVTWDEAPGDIVISASIGAASTERSGYELRRLLVDADGALYLAKHGGRNRVVLRDSSDLLGAR
jgi:diguanylate cyclase (GGDEF)-like protein